jgi:hypothetical protein|tara:strand:- start:199 stop:423 length:225 start_codon:yes stop_codon:yes gene_type:complete
MESEQLYEMWENLKSYIPVKDRLEAGEVFIRMLDDSGMSPDDIEILIDGDNILQAALDNFFEDEDDNDDEEDWD